MRQWIRVTKQRRCLVCQKPDWCTYTTDGAICCMRIQSARLLGNGGWLHKADGTTVPIIPLPPPPPPKPPIDGASMMGNWLSKTSQDALQALGVALGVSWHTLRALSAAWAVQHSAWAFPMQDGQGNIIGIRLRNDNGEKWAVKGSRNGIFVPNSIPHDVALVCEGPTDTAAALDLGFFAIGRPACSLGAEQTLTACRRLGVRRIIVVADNDGVGLQGAARVAKEIGLPSKVWAPPTKDLREYVRIGGDKSNIEADLANTMWSI